MTRILGFLFAALTSVSCAGQELGRLFYSPAERAALDAGRQAGTRRAVAAETPAPLRIDGYVRRSGGGATVWVNGKTFSDGALEGVRIAPGSWNPGEVVVSRRSKGSDLKIRVGSTVDAGSGVVLDVIEEGQLRIGR